MAQRLNSASERERERENEKYFLLRINNVVLMMVLLSECFSLSPSLALCVCMRLYMEYTGNCVKINL